MNEAPSRSIFGITVPGSFFQPTGYLAGESNTLGDTAVLENNYGLGNGTSVPLSLPGSQMDQWKLVRAEPWQWGGWGGYQVWELQSGPFKGARMLWMHLQKQNVHIGDVRTGGQTVAMSGWPTSATYSGGLSPGPSDAHFAVAFNQLAVNYLGTVNPATAQPALADVAGWFAGDSSSGNGSSGLIPGVGGGFPIIGGANQAAGGIFHGVGSAIGTAVGGGLAGGIGDIFSGFENDVLKASASYIMLIGGIFIVGYLMLKEVGGQSTPLSVRQRPAGGSRGETGGAAETPEVAAA